MAAPPRASPSSFDSTTPVMSVCSANPRATFTASWPVMASTTSSTSSGSAALRTAASSRMSASSIWSLPAVSTITVSRPSRTASFMAAFTRRRGFEARSANTGTSIRPPSVSSWSMAAGRWRSAATSIGLRPCSFSMRASLPADVVFPEPWRPTTRIVSGGAPEFSGAGVPPRVVTSSSRTIFTTCCPGERLFCTSEPTARARMRSSRPRTTETFTSASSRASRTSRRAASTSASLSRPLPVSREKTPSNRWVRVSNMPREGRSATTVDGRGRFARDGLSATRSAGRGSRPGRRTPRTGPGRCR